MHQSLQISSHPPLLPAWCLCLEKSWGGSQGKAKLLRGGFRPSLRRRQLNAASPESLEAEKLERFCLRCAALSLPQPCAHTLLWLGAKKFFRGFSLQCVALLWVLRSLRSFHTRNHNMQIRPCDVFNETLRRKELLWRIEDIYFSCKKFNMQIG